LSLTLLVCLLERVRSNAKDDQEQAEYLKIAQKKGLLPAEAKKYLADGSLSRFTSAASVEIDQQQAASLQLLATAAATAPTAVVAAAAATAVGNAAGCSLASAGAKVTTAKMDVNITPVPSFPAVGATFPTAAGSDDGGSDNSPMIMPGDIDMSPPMTEQTSTASTISKSIERFLVPPVDIPWLGGVLVNGTGQPVINVVIFAEGSRNYQVHRFSLANTAANGIKLQFSVEPLSIRKKYSIQLYNWWIGGAVFKGFKDDEDGLIEKRPLLSRCVVYDKLHKHFNYYIVQVMMSTCNSPIVAVYVCDLDKFRREGWESIPFYLLRFGKFASTHCFCLHLANSLRIICRSR